MSTRHCLSRREFLGLSGLIVSFGLSPALATAQRSVHSQFPHKSVAPNEVDGFLAIDRHGNVAVFSGKVDLGTGVRTAITQIVAEELDVSMARINVIQGDTSLTPDQGPTFGSLSIEIGGMQIRQAAATARHALIRQAALRFNVQIGRAHV